MSRLKITFLLLFLLAAVQASASGPAMQLEIRPATASSPGGWRLPMQFIIRNTGDQPIHSCLSGGHVVHLWDQKVGYTLAEQRADQPSCEEPFDLPPHGEYSWTEEIAIPPIKASGAKIVGFAQVVPPACGQSACEPVWLTASYAPFQIDPGAQPKQALDLRTGVTSTELAPLARTAGSGTDR